LNKNCEKLSAAGEPAAWKFSGLQAGGEACGANTSRCVIIGAAPCPSGGELIRANDFVIVCDGGLDYALSRGIGFSVLVGDFDSFEGPLPEGDFRLERLIPEKDDTDIEHAVKLALSEGYREFLLLGAAGGRTDHFLGNLALGRRIAEAGGSCVITGTGSGEAADSMKTQTLYGVNAREMFFIFSGSELDLLPVPDAYVSIFPLSGALHGVTLEGFKYPAADQTFSGDNTLGVSNEFVIGPETPPAASGGALCPESYARIRVGTGAALVTVALKH